MKKFGKILIVVLALAMLIGCCFAFTACNDDDTLLVATNCEFAPFEYLDESGKPVGIDMEIAAALATKLGLKLEIKDMAFDSVVSAVASGSCDIGMAGLTITEERKQSVDFTISYFKSSQVVIAKEGDPILSATTKEAVEAILAGKTIGVQNGTTGYSYSSGDSDAYEGITNPDNVKGYTSGALAVSALLSGSIDYVVIDKAPAEALAQANPGTVASNIVLTTEDYAFAVKKGNTEFLNKVNAAIAEIIEEGTFDRILLKYMGAPEA